MFTKYFKAAEAHLRKSGHEPLIIAGEPVSESDRRATESRIGMRIPPELWEFIKEMGDGYWFRPGEKEKGIQLGRLR